MMKSLWKSWCEKVDNHNSKITYGNYEETWSYYTIFYPILFGIFLFILLGFLMMINSIPITEDKITKIIILSVGSIIVLELCLYINWKVNEN